MTRIPRVDHADGLLRVCVTHGLPRPHREVRFHPSRMWRFDLAWPAYLLAVEVEGGGYVAGRHATGKGIEDDCEKLSTAVALGWSVMRVTPRQFERADPALTWIRAALAARRPPDPKV